MIHQNLQTNSLVTPVSNTGVKCLNENELKLSIDWLAGTFHDSRLDEVKSLIKLVFSDLFPFPSRGRLGFYQRHHESIKGVKIGFEPDQSPAAINERHDAYLSIPGEVIRSVSIDKLHWFFRRLHDDFQFKCSRLDVYIDDYKKRVSAEDIFGYYKNGQLFGFRAHHYHTSGASKELSGSSIMLGKRGKAGAGKYLRCYDKEAQSNGKIKAFRFELELSGQRSRQHFNQFATISHEAWADLIKGIISGAVDFLDTPTGKRCDGERLKFWQEIIGEAVSIPFESGQKKTTLATQKKWLKVQVSRVLAKVMNCYEDVDDMWTWFYALIEHGYSRLTNEELVYCDLVKSGELQMADIVT
jgi:hypothetical protein